MTVQRAGKLKSKVVVLKSAIFEQSLFFGRILLLSILVLFCACATGAKGGKGSSSGLESVVLDRSVSPGADFYGYVNNNWLQTHPLPADKTWMTTFSELQDENNLRLRAILEGIDRKAAAPGSDEAKLALLYDMYLDSEKRNRDGMLSVAAPLKNIADISEKTRLAEVAADLRKQGVLVFFSSGIDVDRRDSARYIFTFWQGGISMYEGFYLGADERSVYLREELEKHQGNIFTLAGFPAAEAQRKAHAVFTIEKRMAAAFYDNVRLRDPQAGYNKTSVAELSARYPAFDWQAFFDTFGVSGLEEVNAAQPEFLAELNRIIAGEPLENLKTYMQWHLLSTAAPLLSDDFYEEDFRFFRTILQGQQESAEPWQRALGVVESFLGDALSRLFVEKYFSPEAKERVTVMVENIRDAFSERIARLEWMGDGTKEQAQEKLRNTKLKIGYPEKWEDYAGLDLQNDSLFANIRRGVSFRIARGIADMKKPVDHAEWSALPVMVDAYYEWSNNAIIFPAAILQPPFFDMAADDAYNYGAIGAVIGHELSHGFDDEGRQFDKDGNMRDWWEAEDSERFNARTRVLVDCFNAIELAPGLYANGELTLGENIADNGGLHTAFAAFQARRQAPRAVKGGFSPEQRFFIAYAILWRDKMNDEALANFTLTNKHAMGKWRVNAALPHIDEWYTAFGIQEGDPLYIAPEKRASIW